MEITPNFLDIDKIIASKNPHLLKVIPGFVLRYIKRIVHQEQLNGAIWRNRDLVGIPFADAILKEFGVKIEVYNAPETLPSRLLLACNHPLGGLDGMALMVAVGRLTPDIVLPVNDLLMNVPGLKPLFIPINKHGKNTENVRILDETFASDKTIIYFPAGLVSRKQKGGVIKDLQWQKTFITKARRYQRDVMPVYISGRNSNWFYNLARWRRRLGIRSNIEMFYLVDEMVKQKDKVIKIVYGNVIPYTTFDGSKKDLEWAGDIRNVIYEMEKSFPNHK